MRNKGDKIVSTTLIKSIQKRFRVLDDWHVHYIEESRKGHTPGTYYYNGQCTFNIGEKQGYIYPCPKSVRLRDYVMHEMLHLAIKAIKNRNDEETLVRDLCDLIQE